MNKNVLLVAMKVILSEFGADIDAFRIEESWFRGILRRVFKQ
jgi:hypothetical protein